MASAAEIRTRRTAAVINELVEKIYPSAPLRVFSSATRELFRTDTDSRLDAENANMTAIGMELLKLKGEDAVDTFRELSECDAEVAKKLLVILLKLGGHLSKREDAIIPVDAEEPSDRERRLQGVKDFLTAMQGVSGHYLRNENRSLILTKGEEKVLVHALEMGKKVSKIRAHAAKLIAESSFGLVSQRFGHALHDELSGFDRFIAILEQQAIHSDARHRVSLFQMHSWTLGVFRRIDLLLSLCESTESLRGGALSSAVYAHTRHGNPARAEISSRITDKIFAPIAEMIRTFAQSGKLPSDPHTEFFIVRTRGAPRSRFDDDEEGMNKALDLYGEFTVNISMVPTFLGKDFAKRVLTTACDCRIAWKLELGSAIVSALPDDEASDRGGDVGDRILAELILFIDGLEQSANDAVITCLMNEHRLVEHLTLLKRFMLLGQGDFAQSLIELTWPLLSKPVNEISRMELLSCVEEASRATLFTQDEMRMDCFLMDDDRSALSWDCFSLDYHVDFPLDLIISPEARIKYQKVFRFLWRLKRVQFALERAWKQQNSRLDDPSAIRSLIHKCHLIRSEMVHFTTTVLSYVMFEVLETSFEQLKCDLKEAKKLIQLIEAHDSYLDDVLLKALIIDNDEDKDAKDDIDFRPRVAPASRSPVFALRSADFDRHEVKGLSSRLDQLMDLVLRFCAIQDRFSLRVSEERQARSLVRRARQARARETRWAGGQEEEEEEVDETGAREVAEEYGIQVDALTSEFWESLNLFLNALDASTSGNLRFLGFRLDFNRFY